MRIHRRACIGWQLTAGLHVLLRKAPPSGWVQEVPSCLWHQRRALLHLNSRTPGPNQNGPGPMRQVDWRHCSALKCCLLWIGGWLSSISRRLAPAASFQLSPFDFVRVVTACWAALQLILGTVGVWTWMGTFPVMAGTRVAGQLFAHSVLTWFSKLGKVTTWPATSSGRCSWLAHHCHCSESSPQAVAKAPCQ
jgi:hypothetical protein